MEHAAWVEGLMSGFSGVMSQVLAFLPKILGAAVLLVVGWLLARLLRMLSVRVIGGLDRFWNSIILRAGLEQLQPRQPPTRIVGEIVFWLVVLFVVTLATDVLGLKIFTAWLSQVVAYVPVLLAGLLIVLVGFVISSLLRDFVATAASSAGFKESALLGRTTQTVVLSAAVVIGADQIGVDVSFISIVVGVVLAATLGSVALAFGVGAATHVSNLIAGHQAKRLYRVGDTVHLDELEGKVVELTATKIILDGRQGRITIPAKLFDERVSIVTAREEEGEVG